MRAKKKELKDLPDNWEEIAHAMFASGAAQIQVVKAIGLNRDLHRRFKKDYEEYRIVMMEGVELSECWWLQTGKDNLNNRNFNNPLFNTLTAKFKWSEHKDEEEEPEKTGIDISKYKIDSIQELENKLQ